MASVETIFITVLFPRAKETVLILAQGNVKFSTCGKASNSMRVWETETVPLKCGTPLLPPSSMAGKEALVPTEEDWPKAAKTNTAKNAIRNNRFPRRGSAPQAVKCTNLDIVGEKQRVREMFAEYSVARDLWGHYVGRKVVSCFRAIVFPLQRCGDKILLPFRDLSLIAVDWLLFLSMVCWVDTDLKHR